MNPFCKFEDYLSRHTISSISTGQSGAEVCRLNNGTIAKYVSRALLPNEETWERYRRESLFYSHFSNGQYSFIPEVIHNELRNDELLLILREYRPLRQREMMDPSVLGKVLDTLAEIHALPTPGFLPKNTPEPVCLCDEALSGCKEGWVQVLNEHPGTFSMDALEKVCDHINCVNKACFNPCLRFVHGDFHCENLLMDEKGELLVCDWQNCGEGEATGDLSFLLSRLAADGVVLSEEHLLKEYCLRAGISDPQALKAQMSLAGMNTSFLFWHHYLHGASPERVGEIFHKMCDDMDFLLNLCQ